MFLNFLIFLTVMLALFWLWRPRLRQSQTWRAMVTPLASIIGSGFLVLGPILSHAYAAWAPLVMAALCAVAWGFGGAISFNIRAIEARPEAATHRAEQLADGLLGFAFTISVAYYLNLFGAFALSLTPFDSPANARALTTGVYVLILAVGFTRGFSVLERMEYASVALKLAIIAGLFVGLVPFNAQTLAAGDLHVGTPSVTGWAALTLGFGLIVTVQGFETSRYLGDEYSAPVRIRSMRRAQLLATGIYLLYIALVAYALPMVTGDIEETAIVELMGVVAPVLPLFLVAAALAAQFSAAVADTGGSGGLLAELSRGRISPRQAYLFVGGIGIALTWLADVFQIIAYASRAFAAYYAVQAAIAAARAGHKGDSGRTALFTALAALGAAIAIFGQSVE